MQLVQKFNSVQARQFGGCGLQLQGKFTTRSTSVIDKTLDFTQPNTSFVKIMTYIAAFSFSAVSRSGIRAPLSRPSLRVRAAAGSDDDVGVAGTAAIALGLLANPICLWSEYTLATTGSGLPADVAGGALGAAEGVSYLVILGIVGWSAYTKVSTGSGLPAGFSGLLGAVEGFSYLSLLGGIVAFAVKSFS